MRLIDADELNEIMTAEWFLDSLAANEDPREIKKKIENAIDSVSLAYDIDKVVEELEEKSDDIPIQYEDNYEKGFDDGIGYAIDIVKRGGN